MGLYQTLVNVYYALLSPFPPLLQWLITLVLLIALVVGLIGLIRRNVLFVIILLVLLPFLLPVVWRLVMELYQFVLFLVSQVGSPAPR